MGLKDQLNNDMKTAMRAGDKSRLGVIRLMLAAIKRQEVDQQIEMDDNAISAILSKEVKQRRDSVSQFTDAGRSDLADKELAEIDIIYQYLPEPFTAEEIATIVEQAISNSDAQGPADMGKVMGIVKPQVQGRADMGQISQLVKAKLNS